MVLIFFIAGGFGGRRTSEAESENGQRLLEIRILCDFVEGLLARCFPKLGGSMHAFAACAAGSQLFVRPVHASMTVLPHICEKHAYLHLKQGKQDTGDKAVKNHAKRWISDAVSECSAGFCPRSAGGEGLD